MEGKSSLVAGGACPMMSWLMRVLVIASRQSTPNDQTSAYIPEAFPCRI